MVVLHCLKRTTNAQNIIKDNLVRNGQKIHQASSYIIPRKARQSLQKLFPEVILHQNQTTIVENYNTRTWRRELREKDLYPYKLCPCVQKQIVENSSTNFLQKRHLHANSLTFRIFMQLLHRG